MTAQEVYQKLIDKGFKVSRTVAGGKLILEKNGKEILYCAPCGFIKDGGKTIRFLKENSMINNFLKSL